MNIWLLSQNAYFDYLYLVNNVDISLLFEILVIYTPVSGFQTRHLLSLGGIPIFSHYANLCVKDNCKIIPRWSQIPMGGEWQCRWMSCERTLIPQRWFKMHESQGEVTYSLDPFKSYRFINTFVFMMYHLFCWLFVLKPFRLNHVKSVYLRITWEPVKL